MGGDSPAHEGETYSVLLSRTIPVVDDDDDGDGELPRGADIGTETINGSVTSARGTTRSTRSRHFSTQTVGETHLLREIATIHALIASGDRSREVELAPLERMRLQVRRQGLESEIDLLQGISCGGGSEDGGSGSGSGAQGKDDERIQQLKAGLQQLDLESSSKLGRLQELETELRQSESEVALWDRTPTSSVNLPAPPRPPEADPSWKSWG